MFERPHHQRIGRLLAALNADLLREHHCLFAGGTAIALREGEFRESVDADFVVADRLAYRALRDLLNEQGTTALFRAPCPTMTLAHPLRMDQYGLRTRIGVDVVSIKLEIIHEARMPLAAPTLDDQVCGVATATRRDLAAMKLLANADRWGDDSVFSRDVIDLAHITLPAGALREALRISQDVYGNAVPRELGKALQALQRREGWLDRCLQALAITTPKAQVWRRLRALRPYTA